MRFLRWFNFLQRYYDYKLRLAEVAERVEAAARIERAEERAAFLAALQGMTAVATEASKASQAQATALNSFLDSFKTTGPLQVREWDEAADNKRYLEKHLPPELQGLDRLDQFQMLVDKLNAEW